MLDNVQTLYCLVGEQPIPNLIPIKYMNPTEIILWRTNYTSRQGKYLVETLKSKNINVTAKEISPYQLESIVGKIEKHIKENKHFNSDATIFNLTGGTKLMFLGSFLVCQKYKIPFCYLQSDGGRNILYFYLWKGETPVLRKHIQLEGIIVLDEYIRFHVGDYRCKDKHTDYEFLVYNCLKNEVDEIKINICLEKALEVDLIFRIGNQVGIAEIKTGNKARGKEGIDQLNTAGAREYLGIYTKRFLIVDREYPDNNKDLAVARNVIVIELKNSPVDQKIISIDEKDRQLLVQTILKEMTQ